MIEAAEKAQDNGSESPPVLRAGSHRPAERVWSGTDKVVAFSPFVLEGYIYL